MIEILLEGHEDSLTIKNRIYYLTTDSLIESIALSQDDEIKQLADLNEDSVFLRLLDCAQIDEADRAEYISTYKEIRRLMDDEEVSTK